MLRTTVDRSLELVLDGARLGLRQKAVKHGFLSISNFIAGLQEQSASIEQRSEILDILISFLLQAKSSEEARLIWEEYYAGFHFPHFIADLLNTFPDKAPLEKLLASLEKLNEKLAQKSLRTQLQGHISELAKRYFTEDEWAHFLFDLGDRALKHQDYESAAYHYRVAQKLQNSLSQTCAEKLSLIIAACLYAKAFEDRGQAKPLVDYVLDLFKRGRLEDATFFFGRLKWAAHVLEAHGEGVKANTLHQGLLRFLNTDYGIENKTAFKDFKNGLKRKFFSVAETPSVVHSLVIDWWAPMEALQAWRGGVKNALKVGDWQEKRLAFQAQRQGFIQSLFQSVEAFLGPVPCEYAVILLGSSGRREAALYSDLEFGIILGSFEAMQAMYKKEIVQEYFDLFLLILKLKIIALGESPDPHQVFSKGFCLDDGGNFPLVYAQKGKDTGTGKTELIRPLYALPEFKDTLRDLFSLKTGAHEVDSSFDAYLRAQGGDPIIAFTLLDAQYGWGDLQLVEQYHDLLQKKLNEKSTSFALREIYALALLESVLRDQYKLEEAMTAGVFDAKELFKCAAYTVKALALYSGIDSNHTHSAAKLEALYQQDWISKAAFLGLKEWLLIAEQWRNSAQAFYQCEREEVSLTKDTIAHYGLALKQRQQVLALQAYILKPSIKAIETFLSRIQMDASKPLVFKACEDFSAIECYEQLQAVHSAVPPLLDFLGTYAPADGVRICQQQAEHTWQGILCHTILEPYEESKKADYRASNRVLVWLGAFDHVGVDFKVKPWLLKVDIAKQLLTPEGQFDEAKKHPHGRGQVLPIRRNTQLIAYAKSYPELPLDQLMVQDLAFRVSGFGQVGSLTKFVPLAHPEEAYPVLLSPDVGLTLAEESTDVARLKMIEAQFDPYAFSLKCFESYLLVAGDDKPSNLVPKKMDTGGLSLISIDADRAFGSVMEGNQLGLKTALYCAATMKSAVDPRALFEVKQLKPFELLGGWLKRYARVAEILNAEHWFTLAEKRRWQKHTSFEMKIVEEGRLSSLYQRWKRLQTVLEAPGDSLFSVFESLMPRAMALYRAAYSEGFSSLQERFRKLPTDYRDIEACRVHLMKIEPERNALRLQETPAIVPLGQNRFVLIIRGRSGQPERIESYVSLELMRMLDALFERQLDKAQRRSPILPFEDPIVQWIMSSGHQKIPGEPLEEASITYSQRQRERQILLSQTLVRVRGGSGVIRNQSAVTALTMTVARLQETHQLYEERAQHLEQILSGDLSIIDVLQSTPALLEDHLKHLNWDRFNPTLQSEMRDRLKQQTQRALLKKIKDIPLSSLWLRGYQVPIQECLEGVLKHSIELTELVMIDCEAVTSETLGCLKHFKTLQKVTLEGLPAVDWIQGPLSALNAVQVQGCGSFAQIACEVIKPYMRPAFLQLTLSASRYQVRGALVFSGSIPSNFRLEAALCHQFLKLVAEGEQEKAEQLLQVKPALAIGQGRVTDLSGRTFENITALQYALWALDTHMVKMLRRYLSTEQIIVQLNTTGSWVEQHGLHAGVEGGPFDRLIKAYEEYHRHFDEWYKNGQFDLLRTHWYEAIGGAQRLLPVHAVNEYCHPQRVFQESPSLFLEQTLPRLREIVDTADQKADWFSASDHGLGRTFGIYRGDWRCAWAGEIKPNTAFKDRKYEMDDYRAILLLVKIRTEEREAFIREISTQNDRLQTQSSMYLGNLAETGVPTGSLETTLVSVELGVLGARSLRGPLIFSETQSVAHLPTQSQIQANVQAFGIPRGSLEVLEGDSRLSESKNRQKPD